MPPRSRQPRAAPKPWAEQVQTQATVHDTALKPLRDAAGAGPGPGFFGVAAQGVFGTFWGCLGSFTRLVGRAASGRPRFTGLGAGNARTRALSAGTTTPVVNTETRCALRRTIAALGRTGPITLVRDNACYHRNAVVQALATEWKLTRWFRPSNASHLNLIERWWKLIKRRVLDGRSHPTFRVFQAAIQETRDGLSTTHADRRAALMTLNFQQFKDVSLMTA